MREEYEFDVSKGRRGSVLTAPGKSRITIMIDDDVLAHFRELAGLAAPGYQTLINAALRGHVERESLEEVLSAWFARNCETGRPDRVTERNDPIRQPLAERAGREVDVAAER